MRRTQCLDRPVHPRPANQVVLIRQWNSVVLRQADVPTAAMVPRLAPADILGNSILAFTRLERMRLQGLGYSFYLLARAILVKDVALVGANNELFGFL